MLYNNRFTLNGREIGYRKPTYFIADIGANHDGSLVRAVELIERAAESGADCVKFQHFQASSIVSDVGFRDLKIAHQTGWEKPVYEVYEDYSLNRDWNETLVLAAKKAGVHWMTTPYDLEAVEQVRDLLFAYKIGSGDITYHQLIATVAHQGKPTFLATGASTMREVINAVDVYLAHNPNLCLMQCNTNYTGDPDNFKYVNLWVLNTYASIWSGMPLGLSDHTPGHVTALGAVALGACVIEKHFTDDTTRKGPDHAFALDEAEWTEMVLAVRQLEMAMGDGFKLIEANEVESHVVQRRALRLKYGDRKGAIIKADEIEALRPCPEGAYTPTDMNEVVGRVLKCDKGQGRELYPDDLE